MINKILHYWKGYLKIDIRGNALGRFISQISELGILLWNIEYLSYDHYRGCIYKDDYNKLRPLLRKRRCQVKILEKRGFPFSFKNKEKALSSFWYNIIYCYISGRCFLSLVF